ncbi:MAG: RidA family protein [Actinobacteria bacterium]|nr:RidA family protein [Actinomycetota bacterium]
MAKIVKVKSGSPYEERESYSRVVCVDDWIFVSNTAGRNYVTREMSTDPVEQLRQAMKNVEGALAAVGATLADVVRSRVTIPNVEHASDVMAAVGEVFRGVDPASTVLCSPLGGPEYLVEVEITAYRGASASAQERIVVDLSA